jgi:hypothetical protein
LLTPGSYFIAVRTGARAGVPASLSSFNFASISCVWVVAGTCSGYILESLDQKTRGFLV